MDSSVAPSNQSPLLDASGTSNNPKGSNSESSQRNSQDQSKESEKQLPVQYQLCVDIDREAELKSYDQKQTFWILLYLCFLLGNIFPPYPLFKERAIDPLFLLQFGDALLGMMAGLLITAPHLLQMWAVHKKSLKATNRGIKVLCIYWAFVAVPFFILGFAYLYAEEIHALFTKAIQITQEQIHDHPQLLNISPLPPLQGLKGRAWNALHVMGKGFASYAIEYFAARKFRNYVIQREKFLKKNE